MKEVAASVVAMEAAAVAVARQGMLSCTRLELPSFPSSTSRSPSPSKSAAAIDNVAIDNVDVLPPGSSMLVGNVPPLACVPPALTSTAAPMPPPSSRRLPSLD